DCTRSNARSAVPKRALWRSSARAMSGGSVSRTSASRCKRSNSGRAVSSKTAYNVSTQRRREMARCPSQYKSAVIIACPRCRGVFVVSWCDVKRPWRQGDIDLGLLHDRLCRKAQTAVQDSDAMRDVVGTDLTIILVPQYE